jgi:hypothetical protein
MNAKQKTTLWVGIIAFLLIGLFPPWLYQLSYWEAPRKQHAGYAPLLAPPPAPRGAWSVKIDTERLYIQWAIVVVATGGLLTICSHRKKDSAGMPDATHPESD